MPLHDEYQKHHVAYYQFCFPPLSLTPYSTTPGHCYIHCAQTQYKIVPLILFHHYCTLLGSLLVIGWYQISATVMVTAKPGEVNWGWYQM